MSILPGSRKQNKPAGQLNRWVWLDEKGKKSSVKVSITHPSTGWEMAQPGHGTEHSASHHNAWKQRSDVPCYQNLSPKHEKGNSRPRLGTGNFWELCWSISESFVLEHCMEAAWAQHTQPSASVTHNFDAKVRQGDCSCFLWEDTPQGTCIPQAKCCLYEVLSWLYRRKPEGNYWGVQSCHCSCFCGLFCWQSHKSLCWGSRTHGCFPSSARLPERNVAVLRRHREAFQALAGG